jgi:hypothetical protein
MNAWIMILGGLVFMGVSLWNYMSRESRYEAQRPIFDRIRRLGLAPSRKGYLRTEGGGAILAFLAGAAFIVAGIAIAVSG